MTMTTNGGANHAPNAFTENLLRLLLHPQRQQRRRAQPQAQNKQEYPPADPQYYLEPLDDLFHKATNITRAGVVDLLDNFSDNDNDSNNDNSISPSPPQVALCHIAFYSIFSYLATAHGPRYPFALKDVAAGGFAAAHLALDMLNKGDGSVVTALEGLQETCPIRFTTQALDTGAHAGATIQSVMSLLQPLPQQQQICAFSGPLSSGVSMPAAILTGIAGKPQMSAFATASQLDDKATYPLFARLIASDSGQAVPVVLYLKAKGITHFGVVHWTDDHGNAVSRALLETATLYYPELNIVAVDIPSLGATELDYQNAIATLKRTNFRWFYGLGSVQDNAVLLQEATKQGIAGTGQHMWFFYDATSLYFDGLTVPKDSDTARAARGVGLFGGQWGRPGMPVYDKFVQRWKALDNPHDVPLLDARMVRYPAEPDFDRATVTSVVFEGDPEVYASIVFDEIIMLGLAACRVATASQENGQGIHVDGTAMFQAMLEITFEGATGKVALDAATGSRLPETALFQMDNVVEEVVNDTHVTFRVVESNVMIEGVWIEEVPFIYNDGTTNIPEPLPQVYPDIKYIGSGLRIAGYIMAAILLLASGACALWTFSQRGKRVVKASQPIFLLLLCLGTLTVGLAIIPLGIDDEMASQQACNVACMAAPWFASVGFALIFTALFSKTWRANRIISNPRMRRIKLTAFDVMAPLIAILLLNFATLTMWTVVSPLKWERDYTNKDAFGRYTESRGFCSSDNYLPFVIVLAVVDVGALLLASHQAYQARNISTEFAESEYITKAIVCMLLVSAIGVPTLIIVSDDPKANYFAMTSVIFVLCIAVLWCIFVPKITASRNGNFDASRAIREAVARTSTSNMNGLDMVDGSSSGLQILDNQPALAKLRTEVNGLRMRIKDLEERLAEKEKNANVVSMVKYNADRSVVDSTDAPHES